MTHAIWAYPWDLHDIGLDEALSEIATAGIDGVSLATSYHAGRFLQPGNPRRRVYFPEDGTVYYRPDPARWSEAEIAPRAARIVGDEGDMLRALVDRREAGGPAVHCWTVCLHNTRLGQDHPDHVSRTCFGDPALYGLCPSSPAARDYVAGLVAEISHLYRPDRIELESPCFMGFAHGYHHEKDGLGLLPEDVFLLGLCFCDHCRARAAGAGVDVEPARRFAAERLGAAFDRALPEPQQPGFPSEGLAAWDDTPLAAFLAWRTEPVTSLIARCREVAHAETQALLIDVDDAWMGGVDRAAAAAACDGVLLCAYTVPAEEVATVLSHARAEIGDRTLVAGFQLFHPEVAGPADYAARLAAALPLVDGTNHYNLGLVPRARLGWLRSALASSRPHHGGRSVP